MQNSLCRTISLNLLLPRKKALKGWAMANEFQRPFRLVIIAFGKRFESTELLSQFIILRRTQVSDFDSQLSLISSWKKMVVLQIAA